MQCLQTAEANAFEGLAAAVGDAGGLNSLSVWTCGLPELAEWSGGVSGEWRADADADAVHVGGRIRVICGANATLTIRSAAAPGNNEPRLPRYPREHL